MPTPTDNTLLADRLRALAEEAVEEGPLYLVDVSVRGQAGSRTIEVFVDGDDGAGLDALSDVSRRLSFLLDTEADLVKGRYRLNVSSPGVDRPLVLARQYPQHVGRELAVTYAVGDEVVTAVGTLADADADQVVLTIPGQDAPAQIPFDAIQEARVQLPW